MKQALVVAAICEFGGSVLMGERWVPRGGWRRLRCMHTCAVHTCAATLPCVGPRLAHAETTCALPCPAGAGVVGTIRKGIADLSFFVNDPDIFAYGMLW